MTISINVSMAFDGSTWKTPLADMTWTSVTPDVLHQDGVSITRGRSTARDEVRAGTCSFTLQDFDRTYDPENTAGPYYGFLNPGVPVRVSAAITDTLDWDGEPLEWDGDPAVWSSSTYYRFVGFVEDFPQGSTDPADRRVLIPIEATDAFGMLALGRQRGVMQNQILDLNPVAYWPLTEESGSTTVVDLVGAYPGGAVDDPAFGSAELEPGLGSSVEFDGEHDRIDIERAQLIDGFAAGSLVAVIATDVAAETDTIHPIYFQSNGNEQSTSYIVYVDTDGTVSRTATTNGAGLTRFNATDVTDGEPHLVITTGGAVPFAGVCIDSATVDGTTKSGAYRPGNGTALGGSPFATRSGDDNYFPGRLSHVAIYDYGLLEPERQLVVDAYGGRSGETTDGRIDYILDRSGFPSADRDLTTGYTTLGPANHEGQFTLDLIRRVEKTEQGRFFIAQDGTATFHARYHGQLVATSSSATFSDDGSDVGYSQVEVVRPRKFIYNKITVTTDGLSPLTVDDATSIDTHGEREDSVDAPLFQSSQSQRSLAEYVLANSKDPHPRVMGMSVPIHKNLATLAPLVLPLEQGSRVTFERTPVGAGSAIVLDQILEGYTERFDTKTYTWTPHLSPAEPVTFAVWGGSGDEDEWGSGIWGY